MDSETKPNTDIELNEAEINLIKWLGTPEEVLQKIADAEAKENYNLAYNIADDATHYGIIDLSNKLDDIREKNEALQRKLLDTAPLGEVTILENNLFGSVCCQELKEAILAGKVGITFECMTGTPSLFVTTHELVEKVFEDEEDDILMLYPLGDETETDRCPFCKKIIFDY